MPFFWLSLGVAVGFGRMVSFVISVTEFVSKKVKMMVSFLMSHEIFVSNLNIIVNSK